MRCPKCQFDHPSQKTECLKCGIVFSRYEASAPKVESANATLADDEPLAGRLAHASSDAPIRAPIHAPVQVSVPALALALDHALTNAPALEAETPAAAQENAMRELKYRVLALPLALLVARFVAGSGLRVVAGMLTMILHESGHAITAWLTGRWAVPMLWVTQWGQDRSWPVIFTLSAAILAGGFFAWRARRWGWVCIAGVVLMVQLIFLNAAAPPGALIVFGGDGGAMVLGTILMAAFYAPRDGWLRKSWGLRWGLLVIGALSLMYAFHSWSGPYENIPFGEIEGVNLSDPSLLTEMYGWSVLQLVDRYLSLAKTCFAALGAIYTWGLISAYGEIWTLAHSKAPATKAKP